MHSTNVMQVTSMVAISGEQGRLCIVSCWWQTDLGEVGRQLARQRRDAVQVPHIQRNRVYGHLISRRQHVGPTASRGAPVQVPSACTKHAAHVAERLVSNSCQVHAGAGVRPDVRLDSRAWAAVLQVYLVLGLQLLLQLLQLLCPPRDQDEPAARLREAPGARRADTAAGAYTSRKAGVRPADAVMSVRSSIG